IGVARAIAWGVLMAVILPSFLVLTALPSNPSYDLPACCRRDGKHHCAMMMMVDEQTTSDHQFASVPDQCPFRDATINGSRTSSYVATAAVVHCAELLSH